MLWGGGWGLKTLCQWKMSGYDGDETLVQNFLNRRKALTNVVELCRLSHCSVTHFERVTLLSFLLVIPLFPGSLYLGGVSQYYFSVLIFFVFLICPSVGEDGARV